MLGFYSEIWQELPFLWRVSISTLSLVFLGYSISPLGLGSSLVFSVSQQEACKAQFMNESSRNLTHTRNGGNSLDAAVQTWGACLEAIPAHPGLIDEYRAGQQGRSMLFSKEVK